MEVKQGTGRNAKQPPEEAIESAKPTCGRRPYQKAAFRFERVFETTALSCGKVGTSQAQCGLNQKTS
jgi:hypothetical protein